MPARSRQLRRKPKPTPGSKPSPTRTKKPQHAKPDTLGACHWAGGAELLIMRAVAPVTVVPRKRRGVELTLIIFALGLTLGAYALVDINVTGELSSSLSVRGWHLHPARGTRAPRGPVADSRTRTR